MDDILTESIREEDTEELQMEERPTRSRKKSSLTDSMRRSFRFKRVLKHEMFNYSTSGNSPLIRLFHDKTHLQIQLLM